MAAVKPDDVRDVLNLSVSDVDDIQVLRMIKRAAVAVSAEIGTTVDYSSCTDLQKEAVTLLAAIYTLCFLTGGMSAGLDFKIGDVEVRDSAKKYPPFDMLNSELTRLLNGLKQPFFGRA